MKANVVNDEEELLNPGDIYPILINDSLKLIIMCPGCGHISFTRGNHVYNPETVSYTPSIVHNKDFGGCGWHGNLTNGIFTPC